MKFNKIYKLISVFFCISSFVCFLILSNNANYNISQLNIIKVYAAPTVLGPTSVTVICPDGKRLKFKCKKEKTQRKNAKRLVVFHNLLKLHNLLSPHNLIKSPQPTRVPQPTKSPQPTKAHNAIKLHNLLKLTTY